MNPATPTRGQRLAFAALVILLVAGCSLPGWDLELGEDSPW